MKKKIVWLVASSLMVLALVAASCAPAAKEEVTPAPKKEVAPVVKEAAPAVAEKAPAEEKEMLKVTLTKADGTVMEKLVAKPKYGGVLNIVNASTILAWDEAFQAPWTLSPTLAPTNVDLLQGAWYRGLAGTEEMTWQYGDWISLDNVAGDLAESWELAGPDTIIYHIRKGVHWALDPKSEASRLVGGREFTADDAVFNIRRIYIDIPTSTMYGMLGVARPTEVYAKDKYTVVMKAPPTTIGDTLEEVSDLTKMVPPEVVKKYGNMNQWENVVGTGAFILVDYVPMSSATWVRNPNYWMKDPFFPENQLPYPDELKQLIIPDTSTRLAALRTGKVDIDTGTYAQEEALPLLKTNPNLRYKRLPPSGCSIMGFRMDKPELPFKDIRVRKALIMAVDNQEILNTYYGGDGMALTYKIAPIPEYIANGWYTPLEQLPPEIKEIYTYNPTKAKQLLTEAGYPNGFKTEVVISSASGETIDLATIVKEYWAKNLGVDLKLDIKETGVATSLYQRKAFKEMYWGGRAGNQHLMYLCRKGNMYNWAMIDDPGVEEHYEKISAAYFDQPKMDKLMKEMNQYVLSQAWYYPAPRANTYRIWQPWMLNYHGESSPGVYSHWQIVKFLSIDMDLKKAMGY